MPGLSGWDADDISRIGANTAEILDLGQRHPGDLDPQLLAGLSSLDADITRAEPHGQRKDAAASAFDALNDGEAASMLLACAMLAGIGEAHSNILDSEFAGRLMALMGAVLTTQRNRRRKALKEEGGLMSGTAAGPGTENTETGYDDDIPVL